MKIEDIVSAQIQLRFKALDAALQTPSATNEPEKVLKAAEAYFAFLNTDIAAQWTDKPKAA